MLEYNADTPTSLLEAGVIQWTWLMDCWPALEQCNAIHDRLIATCSRFIPASISDSARVCSAGENLQLRAGTRSRWPPCDLDFETPLLLRDT